MVAAASTVSSNRICNSAHIKLPKLARLALVSAISVTHPPNFLAWNHRIGRHHPHNLKHSNPKLRPAQAKPIINRCWDEISTAAPAEHSGLRSNNMPPAQHARALHLSHTKYAAGACSITITMHVVRPHAYSQGPTSFNQPRSHEHSLPASTVCTSRPSSSHKTGALQIAPPSALPTTPRALRRSRSQHPFTHTKPPTRTAALHPELATRGRHR